MYGTLPHMALLELVLRLITSTPGMNKKLPGGWRFKPSQGFPVFFSLLPCGITMFSEAFTLLPDERASTSRSIQLAFSGCVLLLCRFVAVRSFYEGTALAKPPPPLIVAPPLFSRGPWLLLPYSRVICMRFLGPFRSLFSALKYKKKKSAALLSGAYRLVQGYRPSFLQSLINVYAVYFERSTLLFRTFLLFLCRTCDNKWTRLPWSGESH